MEIARSHQGISISQREYTLDLLKETGMLGCETSNIPMELGNKDRLFEGDLQDLEVPEQSPEKGLFFKNTKDRTVQVFTDVDWVGSIDDRKSTSRYCIMVWGNLVTRKSKKQNVVARSNAKAEFKAMAYGGYEAIWIKRLYEELNIQYDEFIQLYCDN
ncbi:hypothetical protein LIER_21042 [Lithospermum erythrorhizon]|uniref:Uncharacterized protein n=1 Tax=Lithospermum erythrorhizon TaxID=34254 RepID=A0AAV3QNT6_LITER